MIETKNVRWEHDLLGEREVPDEAYYGIHTLRAVENFPISGIPLSQFPRLVEALAYVKKACAQANMELGQLEPKRAEAIIKACDEIIGGKWLEQFVVDAIQGGAGTSTNMNANEVIANRGLELLGHRRGEYQYLHPNDDVNKSQSTNDVVPTAIKLAIHLELRDVLDALSELAAALRGKAAEFAGVYSVGRTEDQDAVPITLGQEFGAFAMMMEESMERLKQAAESLLAVGLGGTAIGTGINTVEGYAELATRKLAEFTGIPFRLSRDLVEATQDASEFVLFSSALKTVAVQLVKMNRDLRWLSSGPRCGLGEIKLPELQAGSSIMPGKVNPVIPEVVTEVCFHVIASDTAVTLAAENGELQLDAFLPLVAFEILQSMKWLKNAVTVLAHKCVKGIVADEERCRSLVENSISLVTALVPVIGYEKSTQIAREALKTGKKVSELVLEKGLLSKEQLEEVLNPEQMIRPRKIS